MREFGPLAALYGHLAPVVERAGRVYPAAIEPLPGRAAHGLVEVGQAAFEMDPRLLAGGRAHLERVAARSPSLHDGGVVVLDRLDHRRLRTARSGYFAMLATCDALRAEYLERRSGGGDDPGPLRELAHQAAGDDPLRVGRGRAAAVGVSMMTTVPTSEGPAVVLGRRRPDLALDPDQWDVAGSGMIEPSASGDPLVEGALRELDEELGVAPELVRLTVLGYGYDLLRLRPEICLRVDLPSVHVRVADDEFTATDRLALTPDALERFWREHPPADLTPPAAATLALAEIAAGVRP